MSEIQDEAQIIRVSFEGAEVAIKVGKAGWDFVKDICAVIKNVLDTEKLEGKTSVKKLLKMGGDLQVYKFKTEDLGTVKSLANKYGILYSILPDLNEADGMSEILFHSQAAPRIESIAKKLEGSRIESMDDYMSNAEPDKLGKMVDKMEKKPLVPDEKEYKLVVEELVKNPGTKVSDIRSRLNMTWLEIWPIIKHMEQNGLAKSKGGAVTMKMGADEFREFLDTAQWKALFGGKESDRRSGDRGQDKKIGEIRRIQKEYKDDPNINTVTIDRKMVLEETEKHIKTRIPYKKDEYIWLDKGEITWINENKTIFAGLKKDKKYVVLDSENKPVRTVSGQKLYEQSYDTVIRARMRQEQDNRRKKKQKNYRKTQQTLVEARNVLKGRNK